MLPSLTTEIQQAIAMPANRTEPALCLLYLGDSELLVGCWRFGGRLLERHGRRSVVGWWSEEGRKEGRKEDLEQGGVLYTRLLAGRTEIRVRALARAIMGEREVRLLNGERVDSLTSEQLGSISGKKRDVTA